VSESEGHRISGRTLCVATPRPSAPLAHGAGSEAFSGWPRLCTRGRPRWKPMTKRGEGGFSARCLPASFVPKLLERRQCYRRLDRCDRQRQEERRAAGAGRSGPGAVAPGAMAARLHRSGEQHGLPRAAGGCAGARRGHRLRSPKASSPPRWRGPTRRLRLSPSRRPLLRASDPGAAPCYSGPSGPQGLGRSRRSGRSRQQRNPR